VLHLWLNFGLENVITDLLLEVITEFFTASHVFSEEFLFLVVKVCVSVFSDGIISEVNELISKVLRIVFSCAKSHVRIFVKSDTEWIPTCHHNLEKLELKSADNRSI
jgi:hypothetical protein